MMTPSRVRWPLSRNSSSASTIRAEAPDILPCFDEDDAYLNIPDSSLLLSYNPAQVLKLAGKHYLTGPVILVRTNMDGEFISLTIDQVYLFQKYLMRHSVTLMADGQKLPCICID